MCPGPNVSTVLLGATKPERLTENLARLRWPATAPQHMEAIEAIAESKPDAYGGYGGAGMRDINTLWALGRGARALRWDP